MAFISSFLLNYNIISIAYMHHYFTLMILSLPYPQLFHGPLQYPDSTGNHFDTVQHVPSPLRHLSIVSLEP